MRALVFLLITCVPLFAGVTPGEFTSGDARLVVAEGEDLRLRLAEDAVDGKAVSAPFPLAPASIYQMTLVFSIDRGVLLAPLLQVQAKGQGAWLDIPPTRTTDGWRLATLPETRLARLVLHLRIPGQALGRTSTISRCRLEKLEPLKGENGPNAFWDGSFEKSPDYTGELAFWSGNPALVEVRSGDAADGERYLHIERGESHYVVFPSLPVKLLRLYRFRCLLRGEGAVFPGLHKLGTSLPDAIMFDNSSRIGGGVILTPRLELAPDRWQQIEILAPIESPDILAVQPYFAFSHAPFVEIDAISLEAIDWNHPHD